MSPMKRPYLSVALFSLLLGAGAVASCGGKVVYDGQPNEGAGGAAASTGTSSSHTSATGGGGPGPGTGAGGSVTTGTTGSVTAVSSSTGPSCGCAEFCTVLENCGVSAKQCKGFCNQVPESAKQCVCNLPPGCGGIGMCIGAGTGGMTGGTSVGSSGSGGGGNPGLPFQCKSCVNKAAANQCDSQFNACQNNADCLSILDCHKQCGYSPACSTKCEGQLPNGSSDFNALITCAACDNCPMECAGTGLQNYCVMP
jgi:hypothetical protein